MLQDPSDNFVRLRDFVDAKNCLKLAAFSKDQVGLSSFLTFCIACFLKVVQGFSEKMAEAAAKDLKICKKQVNSHPLKGWLIGICLDCYDMPPIPPESMLHWS